MTAKLLVILLLIAAIYGDQSHSRVAKIDEVEIDLKLNQFKQWVQGIPSHENLAFMINIEKDQTTTTFGQLQITMENKQKDRVNCSFKYPNNICVLQRCTQNVSIRVKCLKQICKADLSVSQRLLYHFQGPNSHKSKMLTVPGQIYKIQKQKFNSLIEVHLQKREDRLVQNDVTIYSNVHVFELSQVEELQMNTLVFGLKPIINNNDQYIYIEGDQADKNKELRFNIITHFDQLREGINIMDFIQTYGRHSNNTYKYTGMFTKNIQVKVRVFAPKQNKNLPFSVTLKGKNAQSDPTSDISRLQLNPIEFNDHKFYDITFIISRSRYQKYKIIYVELGIQKVQDKAIFVQIEVSDVAISDIQISDHVYFSSGQKQELNFTVTPQVKYEIVGQDKQISILTKAAEKYSVSIQTCSLHKGCEIYLKTEKSCEACSFVFDIEKEDIKNNIVYYQVKDDQIEAKIDYEEQLFFKYPMKSKSWSQVVVNTANLMVFAQFEDYERCKIPSSFCHQFVLNQHNPIIVKNQNEKTQNLIVNVVGLQKTSFKLRFIEEINGLKVNVGEKFSYLFDVQEKEIKLKLQIDDKSFKDTDQHLYFNLLAPTSSLLMIVKNEAGQQRTSIDGYVEFPRKSIQGKRFDIQISKVGEAFMQQYVHMTLIVSTDEYGVKLDSTTTHYEKYLPNTQRKYIMQYESTNQNTINIYTQNLQKSHSKMELSIKLLNKDNPDEQNKALIEKQLSRDNQAIDLDFQLENLDVCQQVNCELEITIKNKANVVLQQSITILHAQSVVAIDDSIWNSYQINDLSKTTHFYYTPRDVRKPITILFSSQDKNLYIDYIIYNNRGNHNPQKWPWERHSTQNTNNITKYLTGFQEFKIPTEAMETCNPNCVILITLTEYAKQKKQKESLLIKSYKILVSSTIVQVPEDVKFEITMKTNEENTMFVELVNFKQTKQLTFFTQTKVGRAKVIASLVNKGQDYKLKNNKDFIFDQIQTNLPIELILTALKSYNLKIQQTLLKITFIAQSNVKMYFQFTSALKGLYRLNMDDFQVCSLKEGEQIWYEFIPQRDFSIKFYRGKGFPLFKIIKCQEESFLECLSKQKQMIATQLSQKKKLQQKTKQVSLKSQQKQIEIVNEDLKETTAKDLEIFVEKNYEYEGQSCQNCIYFIWVYGYAQDLQLTINVRSSSTETEMKEFSILNDRIAYQNASHKYLINAEPEVMTIITFRVMEGNCQIIVTDNQIVLYNKKFTSDKNSYADITIHPLSLPKNGKNEESSSDQDSAKTAIGFYNAQNQNKHHILRHLHAKVISRSIKPVEYIISYSIGFSGVFLQDGRISQKIMIPKIPHTFFYHNSDKKSHPYLSLSSSILPNHQSDSSNEFEARFFYYPDKNNRGIKEQFKPQMPPKKNGNTIASTLTHVYELPAIYELYEIELSTKNYIKIVASINHKEIVYLPLGYEYLIKLHPKQSIYLVVQSPQSEYLQLTIKKCDTSIPNLLYTNDAKEFQKGLYEISEDIFNNYDRRLIKTKKSSRTIHMKVTAEDDSQSLFTMTVVPQSDPNRSKTLKMKAGNNGLLSYTSLDTNKVQIQFSPIVCETKNCEIPKAHYYLLLAKNIQNIYRQLYCAENYLISKDKQNNRIESKIINILPQHYDSVKNVYRYQLTLLENQQFIGVKAMYRSNSRLNEITYVPTEVSSLWRQLTKLSFGIIILFALAFGVILVLAVVISTKFARRGYKPISEVE